jgi:hypothetical protein
MHSKSRMRKKYYFNKSFLDLWVRTRMIYANNLFFVANWKTAIFGCDYRGAGGRGIGSEPEFVNLLTSPGIDSQPGGLHRLAESIPGLLKRLQIPALWRAKSSKG